MDNPVVPSDVDETERVRAIWDRHAPYYDRSSGLEARLLGDGRAWATALATGRTLEIAVGTGRNLATYPADVTLTAIDISPEMLAIAARRASTLGRDVRLLVGDAQRLPFDDGDFDAVVCTLALCAIPDDRRAIGEAYRVLRSGGRFILIEHVRSHHRVVRAIERLLERWTLPRQGDHLLRDPLDHLVPVGFVVELAERSRLGVIERIVARRP